VLLRNGGEDFVPVGTTEVGGRTERGDGILLSADILNDDIVHVILLDLGSEVDVDLNAVLGVLFFDGVEEGVEPFCYAKVTDDPGEVDLGETSGLGVVEVVHAVPDGLEDGSKWSNTDTSTDQENGLVV